MGEREPGVSVWPSVQGDREAYPERRFSAAASRPDRHGGFDRSDVVEGRVVGKANSCLKTLTPVRTPRANVGRRNGPADATASAPSETEQALNVVFIYQDTLTRQWAAELWDRVGKLIDNGGICSKSWNLSDLEGAFVFAEAVRAAAEADVLVISVCDAGDLPRLLQAWIDGWMPRRAGRAGTLVALIGVPTRPDALSGRAHEYLETVARRAGLDFLPRERTLAEESLARSTPPQNTPATDLTTA